MALLLSVTGCGTGDNTPTDGFVGAKFSITQVPPGERPQAPQLSGPELGTERTLSTTDYPGKVLVLNVWGSWCAPCRKEAPALQRASERTGDIAQFIGINTKDYDPAPAEAFVRAFGVTYPSIYDPKGEVLVQLSGQLPPTAIPSTLVIDRNGKVAVRVVGEITEITLVDIITDIAAGK